MTKEKKELAAPATAEVQKISFHVAVLNHDGTYFTQAFKTLEELTAYLKTRINQDVSVFAFRGERLKISKPPMRHLLVPGQEPIPLFDSPTEFEEDETGYLGVDPINLEDPPQLKMPAVNHRAAAVDPFDDSGDGLGVFDDVLPDPDS
jgi:hypothetical protein